MLKELAIRINDNSSDFKFSLPKRLRLRLDFCYQSQDTELLLRMDHFDYKQFKGAHQTIETTKELFDSEVSLECQEYSALTDNTLEFDDIQKLENYYQSEDIKIVRIFQITKILKRIVDFKQISSHLIPLLLSESSLRIYPQGTNIYEDEGITPSIYFVIKGTVHVSEPQGKAIFEVGNSFGQFFYIDDFFPPGTALLISNTLLLKKKMMEIPLKTDLVNSSHRRKSVARARTDVSVIKIPACFFNDGKFVVHIKYWLLLY